jgi:sugar (pentulose or hexulose) kinase
LLRQHLSAGRKHLAITVGQSPAEIAECLQQGIRRLKIPDDYLKRDTASNGAAAIRLLNPVSNNTSLQVSITPQGSGSQVQVDQNGIPLTPPWQRMIKRCAE